MGFWGLYRPPLRGVESPPAPGGCRSVQLSLLVPQNAPRRRVVRALPESASASMRRIRGAPHGRPTRPLQEAYCGSQVNKQELQMALDLAAYLQFSGLHSRQITVLSPYQGQVPVLCASGLGAWDPPAPVMY